MKILFYQPIASFHEHVGVLIDEMINYSQNAHEILYVYNSCSMFRCSGNVYGDSMRCALCKIHMRNMLKLIPRSVTLVNIESIWSNKKTIRFNYDNVEDLKNIVYKGVKIGYSVLSSYISATRNLYPRIDKQSRLYFDERIETSCKLTDALSDIIKRYQPDLVCSYNARWLEQRPAFDLATLMHIDFISYEVIGGWGEPFYKTKFINSTPHNIITLKYRYEKLWNEADISLKEKNTIGKAFFTKKRKGIAVGDKVYISKQEKGKFPVNWDRNKHNIVIFNSSEDEFSAIGDEFEEYALFPSQYKGIKYIVESVAVDQNIHVWLRIHPNLSNIHYRYHTELYKLSQEYPNITIIGADDSISSYALLDAADKVVVFGSTIGLESAYWKKPTILLAGSIYYYANICYVPKDKGELTYLLKNKVLRAKDSENAIKIGFYYNYRNKNNSFSYIDFNYDSYRVKKQDWRVVRFLKFLGSVRLYIIIYHIIYRKLISKAIKNKNSYYELPREEDMRHEL